MILIAMNCEPINNFKYTTQKSDILINQIHVCILAAKRLDVIGSDYCLALTIMSV